MADSGGGGQSLAQLSQAGEMSIFLLFELMLPQVKFAFESLDMSEEGRYQDIFTLQLI